MKLGEILTRRKLITQQQLEQALFEQALSQSKLGELLVAKVLITKEELAICLQEQRWRGKGLWVI